MKTEQKKYDYTVDSGQWIDKILYCFNRNINRIYEPLPEKLSWEVHKIALDFIKELKSFVDLENLIYLELEINPDKVIDWNLAVNKTFNTVMIGNSYKIRTINAEEGRYGYLETQDIELCPGEQLANYYFSSQNRFYVSEVSCFKSVCRGIPKHLLDELCLKNVNDLWQRLEHFRRKHIYRPHEVENRVILYELVDLFYTSVSQAGEELTNKLISGYIEPLNMSKKRFYKEVSSYEFSFDRYLDILSNRLKKRSESNGEKAQDYRQDSDISSIELRKYLFGCKLANIGVDADNFFCDSFDYVVVAIPIYSDVSLTDVKNALKANIDSLVNDCINFLESRREYKKFRVPTSELKFSNYIVSGDRQVLITFDKVNEMKTTSLF